MARLLQTLSLLILLVVVGLRPLVAESYDSAVNSISQAITTIDDPSPLRTIGFDLAILVAAMLWLAAQLAGSPGRMKWTGLEVGWLVLAVGALGSCFVAGQQRLAINGAIDWLCYPLLAMLLAQLLDSSWRRRVALAVVLAAGAAQAIECAEQVFLSFPDTRADYEEKKAEFWASQGVELDSSKVVLFEQRLKSQEATGFLSHSNVAGSVLALCSLACAALAVGLRGARGDAAKTNPAPSAAAWALAAALAAAVLLTNSRGAIASLILAGAVWAIAVRCRPWIDHHRRRVFIGGWTLAAVGILAVIGHGLYHGSLPGSSLNFRWQYWETSAAMIGDHPLFGLGAENFGRHYTQYKSIGSSEEVANPHNLLVHLTANWGLVGLAGGVLMLLGASWRMLGTTPAPTDPPRIDPTREVAPAWVWAAALLAAVPLGRRLLAGSHDPAYLYYTTIVTGFGWAVGLAVAWPRRGRGEPMERAIGAGLACALLAFLVHDLINFALFVPGAATTFFAAVGILSAWVRRDAAALPDRPAAVPTAAPQAAVGRRGATSAALLAVAAAMAAVVWSAAVPIGRAGSLMQEADALGPDPRAPDLYALAATADPLDPTPLVKLARWAAAAAGAPGVDADGRRRMVELAVTSIQAARRRDPQQGALPRFEAQVHRTAAAAGDPSHYEPAIAAAEEARKLYPEDPQVHELLGTLRLEAGLALHRADLLQQAVSDLREAIRLDDARPPWEFIRRHTERQRTEIEAKIREAQEGIL